MYLKDPTYMQMVGVNYVGIQRVLLILNDLRSGKLLI